jgi:phospholipid/cholesterol/gamma-HCH transport system substrate-binding protein
MIIDITIGSADAPQLKDGDHLESAEVSGLNQVVESVQTAITKVNVLATDVDTRLREVLTPEVASDVGRITHSTAQMMDDVVKGKGLAHALIYEPNLARDANRVFEQAEVIAERISGSVNQIEQVLAEVRTGGGLLHGLVYEKTGGDAVAELEATARDLNSIIKEVQTGHGMIHSLVYEEDRNNLIQNLSEAARIIRHLAEETQEGKGTVGGLLVDPTAYEDLTTVLGNLKRNDLLKALIRYTIVTDGLNKSNGRVDPGTPVTPAPSPTP